MAIKRSTTEQLILGALMLKARHGYDVRHYLENNLGDVWRVPTSQLYAAFKKLEDRGLVSSHVEVQETRPDRRIFEITGAGRKRFLTWLRSPIPKVRDLRMELLAKVFFFDELRLAGVWQMIDSQQELLEKARKALEVERLQMRVPYDGLVLSQKIAAVRVWLEWIESEVRPFLKKGMSEDGRVL